VICRALSAAGIRRPAIPRLFLSSTSAIIAEGVQALVNGGNERFAFLWQGDPETPPFGAIAKVGIQARRIFVEVQPRLAPTIEDPAARFLSLTTRSDGNEEIFESIERF
jgi:hypothetical protein